MHGGAVLAIYVGPAVDAPMEARPAAEAVPGKGLKGDRYFNLQGTFSKDVHTPKQEVTLIESEAIESASASYDVAIDPSETRRNIVTRGVALNHLVDRDFVVGEVTLRGVKLCEPCAHLARVTEKGLLKPLIHRGGLRARIVEGGTIRVGDPISPAPVLADDNV